MAVSDWVIETKNRFQSDPIQEATAESLRELALGLSRRTIDPVLGTPIWDHEDWDILILLDGCRVDALNQVLPQYNSLPDSTGYTWSVGSYSYDWIRRTFSERHHNESLNTGYVTGNAFSSADSSHNQGFELREGENVGYLDEVWRNGWTEFEDGIETLPPNVITDRAIHAWRNRDDYDFDQLVVHYMQPHQPFKGHPELLYDGDNLQDWDADNESARGCVWEGVRTGMLNKDAVWDAYLDNLEWVLDDITNRFLGNCNARVALSADHGNGLGEYGFWAHKAGTVTPQVRRVPWVTIDSNDQNTFQPDVSTARNVESNSNVNNQLEALGYR